MFFCEAQSKGSQIDLLRDTCGDWPFLSHMLVYVQLFGCIGDRTAKPHPTTSLFVCFLFYRNGTGWLGGDLSFFSLFVSSMFLSLFSFSLSEGGREGETERETTSTKLSCTLDRETDHHMSVHV